MITVEQFIDELSNESLKELANKICDKYNIKEDASLASYDFVAGGYLNGSIFTLGEIFDEIKATDEMQLG